MRDLSLSLALFAWMDTSLSIGREIGSRLVRVVERAREAALFFAPSSSARRVSLNHGSIGMVFYSSIGGARDDGGE